MKSTIVPLTAFIHDQLLQMGEIDNQELVKLFQSWKARGNYDQFQKTTLSKSNGLWHAVSYPVVGQGHFHHSHLDVPVKAIEDEAADAALEASRIAAVVLPPKGGKKASRAAADPWAVLAALKR